MAIASHISSKWSPDGRLIAFQRFTSEISADVIVVPALGGTERKVATISVRGRGNDSGSFFGPDASNLAWSPDGRWIAFGGGPSDDGPRGIWLVGVDHPEPRQLTETSKPDIADLAPAFSPDGRYLAFIRERTKSACAVYVLPLGSGLKPAGAPIRLTRDSATVRGLAWTPDGNGLVFSSGGWFGMSRLYRIVGGGDEQRILEGLSNPLNFVVGDMGLYFLAMGNAPKKTSIDFFEFATGKRTTLLNIGKRHWWGMALAPDQRSLLY